MNGWERNALNPSSVGQLFNLMKSCHDTVRLFPSGNPSVEDHLERFLSVYKQFLDIDGQLEIRLVGGFIHVNGEAVHNKVMRLPGPAWFVSSAVERHIERLVIRAGLGRDDAKALIDLFVEEAHHFPDGDAAASFLGERGVDGVAINQEDQELVDMTLDELVVTPPTADPSSAPLTIPQVAPAGFRPQVPDGRRLFIAEADRAAIYEAMSAHIREGNLDAVAETLTLIRGDLRAPDRDDREVAFSSYHVVIRALIDGRQDASLRVVLPTLRQDLTNCEDEDLAVLHLETLRDMIRFFDENGNTGAFLTGIDLLAYQVLRRSGRVLEEAENALVSLLDMKAIERILRVEDPAHKEIRNSLLGTHGTAVVRPLMTALFESEDRNLRKIILEALHRQGPIIYPVLLHELEGAIRQNKPWYVKRNLVTLLSIKPPVDLVPMLVDLIKEDHPKMRDLLHRCLFQIPDQQAYTIGRAILRAAEGRELSKLMRYLHVSKDPSYGKAVRELYEKETRDATKLDIINVLGRMASKECLAFLEGILAKSGRIGGEPRERRLAAAKALAASGKPEAMEHLFKHQKDSDKEVRAVAQGALNAV